MLRTEVRKEERVGRIYSLKTNTVKLSAQFGCDKDNEVIESTRL